MKKFLIALLTILLIGCSATETPVNETQKKSRFERLCGCQAGNCEHVTDLDFEFDKRIADPLPEKENNATWEVKPAARNPYEDKKVYLKSIKLWVTEDMNPKNGKGLNRTYKTKKILEPGEVIKPESWKFEYTSGKSSEYPPPIVWMEPVTCTVKE